MVKNFFILLVILAAFIALPFTSVASIHQASPDSESLVFEGELKFDYGSCYSLGLLSYPLDLLGWLTVFDVDKSLGNLSLNATETSPDTYKGHWVFFSSGCGCCGCELGLFDLFQDSGEVSFILDGFPEVLGLEGDQMVVSGLLKDDGISFSGSMVPIPGALLLFGSGLLGLICIRRK